MARSAWVYWLHWSVAVLVGGIGAVRLVLPAVAQLRPIEDIEPGRSLRTRVEPINAQIDLIQDGTRSANGTNLFHSFREFNIGQNRFVYFVVPDANVVNILARVTGGNPSQIFGVLGTRQQLANGSFIATPANLFLMNPNGIIFGPGARLDVGGSFVATTANAIQFPSGAEFSLTSKVGSTDELLTVNPSAFLFNQLSVAPIQSNAQLLAVPSGQSLLMVGGNITLNNSAIGIFQPKGGRIELGSVSSRGRVELSTTSNLFKLNFPDDLLRGDILIANQSLISVLAENGGSLTIHTRNLDVSGQSNLFAGIAQGLGAINSQAGDITLNATEMITIRGNSSVRNVVQTRAIGNSGSVLVDANTLRIIEGSTLISSIFGTGNAGNIRVAADTINLDGTTPNGLAGGIGSQVASNATGKGGDVTVQTRALTITNGSIVSATTRGTGNAGNVRVAADTINLDGTTPNGLAGGIGSEVASNATGKGGDVTVQTRALTITNGSIVSATTRGTGNAGNVRVAADTINLDGTTPNGLLSSGIGSEVAANAIGNGGDVTVQTRTLNVTNGATVSATTRGTGNAGNVRVTADTINLDGTTPNGLLSSGIGSEVAANAIGNGGDVTVQTKTLNVTNGAKVSAATRGTGNAGNIQVSADIINLNGITFDDFGGTGIFSTVENTASGNGSNVTVQTKLLTINNGAAVSASTGGKGNAGNIHVTANTILLVGTDSNEFASGISSQVAPRATGNAGDVTVQADSLNITNGATISASTFGYGNAGNIRVTGDAITLAGMDSKGRGSNISSEVASSATGTGGDVTVQTRTLTIINGARVSASTLGTGNAGNIRVTADAITLDNITLNKQGNSSILTSSTAFSRAGDIFITANQLQLDNQAIIGAISAASDGGNIMLNIRDILLMRRGSQISTTAGLASLSGNGGNITINAPKGFIVGVLSENNDITANAFSGSGGRVNITAQGIYGLKFQAKETLFSDITASSTFGVSGVVEINTLGLDPSRGLDQLPIALIEPSDQIDQTCVPRGAKRANSFTVTGAGGLPPSPNEPLQSDSILADWVTLNTNFANRNPPENTQSEVIHTSPPLHSHNLMSNSSLVEAQGWMTDSNGTVYLVAQGKTSSPNVRSLTSPYCQ